MGVTQALTVRRDLQDLDACFRGASQSYQQLRDSIESSVTRWRWATGELYSLDPLYLEEDEPEHKFRGRLLYKDDGIVERWTAEGAARKTELAFRGKPPERNPFLDI